MPRPPAACHSLVEQAGVEAHFKAQGSFIPSFHKFYWIGLKTQEWPDFVWINNDSRSDTAVLNYTHWGTYYVSGAATVT